MGVGIALGRPIDLALVEHFQDAFAFRRNDGAGGGFFRLQKGGDRVHQRTDQQRAEGERRHVPGGIAIAQPGKDRNERGEKDIADAEPGPQTFGAREFFSGGLTAADPFEIEFDDKRDEQKEAEAGSKARIHHLGLPVGPLMKGRCIQDGLPAAETGHHPGAQGKNKHEQARPAGHAEKAPGEDRAQNDHGHGGHHPDHAQQKRNDLIVHNILISPSTVGWLPPR